MIPHSCPLLLYACILTHTQTSYTESTRAHKINILEKEIAKNLKYLVAALNHQKEDLVISYINGPQIKVIYADCGAK